jgi:hypothetical protein
MPVHSHHGEEEMFLIIEGEGELRFGDQRYPIRKHDVIIARRAGRRSPPDHQHRPDDDALPGTRDAIRRSTPAVPGLRKVAIIRASAPTAASARFSAPRPRSTTTTASRPEVAPGLPPGQVSEPTLPNVLASASWLSALAGVRAGPLPTILSEGAPKAFLADRDRLPW